MPKIDADCIKRRTVEVHTEDSFARSLLDHILRAAEESLSASGPSEEIRVDNICATVSQHRGPNGIVCVKVKVDTPFGSIQKYVP